MHGKVVFPYLAPFRHSQLRVHNMKSAEMINIIKSVLGRVRNNIHKVLYYVAHDLRHEGVFLSG